MKTFDRALFFISAFQLLSLSAFPQGSLTPPGAPAPTMKTLEQVDANVTAKGEKRIPISALPFTISQPGSYYLTQNVTMSGAGNGITIGAENVTIDLNGFVLSGGGIGAVAIEDQSETKDVTIRNGTIRDWTSAAIDASGSGWALENLVVQAAGKIQLNGGGSVRGCRVSGGLHVSGGVIAECIVSFPTAALTGIYCGGSRSVIRDCKVSGPGAGTGIALSGGTVEGVVVSSCDFGVVSDPAGPPVTIQRAVVDYCTTGLSVGDGAVISQCSLRRSFSAVNGTGILGGARVRVTDTVCALFGTGIELGAGASISGSQSSGNLSRGIIVGEGSRVTDCIVRQNGGDGIEVTGGGFISGNVCGANTGVSIHVTGDTNRIESNSVLSNGVGILLGGSFNIVVKNTLGAGNPIVDAGGNNQIAPTENAATATNPFANLVH